MFAGSSYPIKKHSKLSVVLSFIYVMNLYHKGINKLAITFVSYNDKCQNIYLYECNLGKRIYKSRLDTNMKECRDLFISHISICYIDTI